MAKKRFMSPLETNLILLNPKEEVLLMYRENTGFADHTWCLPSGKVEAYESPREAVMREAAEEVGITVAPTFSSVIHIKEPDLEQDNKLWQSLAFFFVADTWEGDVVNNEPEKHSKIDFFPLSDLPQDIYSICIKGLENYVQRIPFSEFHTD